MQRRTVRRVFAALVVIPAFVLIISSSAWAQGATGSRPSSPVVVANTDGNPVPVTAPAPLPVTAAAPLPVAGEVTVAGSPTVTPANTPATPLFVETVNSVALPLPTPYQHVVIFNQGPTTCTVFVCSARFPPVPPGMRLQVDYVSALFSAPGGSATVRVILPGSEYGVFLPLPQTYGLNTYVASGPISVFFDEGDRPLVVIGGANVNAASATSQVAMTGRLVPVP